MENTNEIREDWYEYYKTLEAIRDSGIVNMYGAAPYLAEYCEIDEKLARQVLINWMKNYSKLSEMFGWR